MTRALCGLMAVLQLGILLPLCGICAVAQANAAQEAAGDEKADAVPQSHLAIRAVAADNGDALEGVDIQFHGSINDGRVNLNLNTDANGLSDFPYPRGAKVQHLWMTARKAGYVPVNFTWRGRARDIELPEEIELKFETGREIGGSVQSEAGKPIAGARVQLTLPVTWPLLEDYFFHAAELTTDDEGRWSWDGAPKDLTRLSMSVKHVDHMDGHDRIQEGLNNKVVLKQGLKVEGQVADRDGNPIVGTPVRLGFDRFGTDEPTTSTDADGKFVLTKCKPGKSLVTVQASGFAPKFQEVVVADKLEPLKFVLEPGHTVRIRVVDSAGKPIPGAGMAPDTWRGHRPLELRLATDAEGMASWDSAPEDAILWDFFKEGYMSTRKKSLAASDEVHVVTMLAPLAISGKITDAKTGKPIAKFAVSEGTLFENSREMYWSRDQAHEFANGEYTVRFNEPAAGRALRVTADGYRPAISPTFKSDEGDRSFDAELEPGNGPSGIVLLPGGQPAVGAEVGLATRRQGMLLQGRFEGRQNGVEVVRTDESGRFQFGAQDDKGFQMIVLHDAGFADILSTDLEKSNQIQLSPWGKLEGRVMIGNLPDADREVRFHSARGNSRRSSEYMFAYGYSLKTDSEGRFQFDRVMPGPGSMTRSLIIDHGRGRSHHYGWNTPVEVKPNETTLVQIGGTGRPVAGRIRLNQPTEEPIDWASNEIAEIQALAGDRNRGGGRGGRYIGALLKSGRFRIPDVPPGDYEVVIPVNGATMREGSRGRTVIGRARMQFTIPEIPGGRSNAPLDLGDIEAHLFDTLDPGEIAPDFTAKLLAGGSTRLREHHGKVVLLEFWMSSDPQSVAELPARRKLYERFADNPRFYFLGLSCDYNDTMARSFVEKEAPGWPQACVGQFNGRIPTLYAVRALPANFLIGPNDKVLAKNLRGAELEKAVADALADESQFAAAGEPAPRFPVTAFDAGAKEDRAPPEIAALILGDMDQGYERNIPHDDHLRAINATGEVLWEVGGIRTFQGWVASHLLAADPERNRIYLAENLGQHLSAFDGAGQRLWRGDLIPASSLAVDQATGNVWVSLVADPQDAATVAFDGRGNELSSIPLSGMDMAADPRGSAFWLVGEKVQKIDSSQKTLFSRQMDRVWAGSVAVNPRDGSVWIAERTYSDPQAPKCRLSLLSSGGEVRRELEMDGSPICALACHPRTGDAWFCGDESGLRRVGAEGPISDVLVESARQVAISPTTGDLWVGTQEGVLRIEPDGKEIARNAFPRRCRILGILPY